MTSNRVVDIRRRVPRARSRVAKIRASGGIKVLPAKRLPRPAVGAVVRLDERRSSKRRRSMPTSFTEGSGAALEFFPLADDDPKMKALEAYILAQRNGTALAFGKH